MRTFSEKIKFLKSVDTDKLNDRVREPYLELKDASNDFSDEELLEGMTEIIDELIEVIADEQVVVIKEEEPISPPEEILIEEEEPVSTEITEMVADDSKVKVNGENAPKTKRKLKVINHSQECIELKDEFLALLKTIIDESCSTEAYPYACSMSQTEQGFQQLATQVFDICISEKDMSIKSALNILESEINAK